MKKKAVVLLSSGLDSTVNLFAAKDSADVVLALTFNYGQRAAGREIEHAASIAGFAGVPHKTIELSWFKDFTRSSLVNRAVEVPVSQSVAIDDVRVSNETAKAVWVPNRNGIFLNIAAAFAESLGADWVVPGFNAEEAVTFPDNSEEFLQAATKSLWYSTANHVEVKCFTTSLLKTDIVRRGVELHVPFDLIWPCYFGGEKPCGVCESCQRFKRAIEAAGVKT
jgi:7-cyano-7-deazaguanine synthase